MAHVDKTVKKAFMAQIAGGTLMFAAGYAPISAAARVGVFGTGAALATGGTVVGLNRIEELRRERELKENLERIFHINIEGMAL